MNIIIKNNKGIILQNHNELIKLSETELKIKYDNYK